MYDASGQRVDGGSVSHPEPKDVAVGVDEDSGRGTYTTTWRVISADGHPVQGAFVFHIEAPGANPGGIAAEVLDAGAPASVTIMFSVVRFLEFALLLLCAGGVAALVLVLRDAGETVSHRLYAVLAAAAGALILVTPVGIVLQGAAAGGFGIGDALRWDVVSAVIGTRFGEVWLARAGLALGLLVIALALRRLSGPTRDLAFGGAIVLAVGLIVSPAAAGHASVSGALSFITDVAHVQAAAAWTGGLVFVLLALKTAADERWNLAARAVPRFSNVAVASVAILIVAGTVNGYLQVRALRGLWDTGYGLLLLAKVGLVLPLLALGAYNNRYAVPQLRAGIASLREQRRFLRAASAEVALMVAIVAVTAVLVNEPPARAEVAPKGPTTATTALGPLHVMIEVDPAVAGENVIDIVLHDPSGGPAKVDELNVSATLERERVGPLKFEAHEMGPGHWTVHGAQLALAGAWKLRLEARRGEFEALANTVTVAIESSS